MPSLAELARRAVATRVHGGVTAGDLVARGIDPATVLDVGTSVNPYGPDPGVVAAVRAAALDRYPDPRASAARQALAAACATDAERVVLGNGATELLWTLARLLLAPGEVLLSCEPAFSELRAAAEQAGARVVAWRATAEDGFALDLDAIARCARATRARVVSLCVPASPSGAVVPAAAIAELARALDDTALVLDQSFLALSERHADLALPMPDNVLCVRSLTKEHGIPGVRVGYLLATAALAAQIEVARPAWTVGAAAQAAACAVSRAGAFVAASRARWLEERGALAGALAALGYAVAPSSVPFFLVEVADAAALARRLLERHRILVRDCSSFGLPAHVRVAARGGAAGERIVAAFAAEVGWAARTRPAGGSGA